MACCLRAAYLEAQGTVIYIRIEADYLVIGADATALAFVDTLLSENTEATAVMVDRQHRPGGHWNNAYPFVRLHQPSEYYGVVSRELATASRTP